MAETSDRIIASIVKELVDEYRCHTVVLYGSRARGLTTPTSDFDVVGVRRTGKKFRITRKDRGFFWDVFVYPEKDLERLGEERFAWKGARLLHEEGKYGKALLKRINKLLKKPYKPQPQDEITAAKVWAQKQLERCRNKDIQGLFRRAEFLTSLVEQYFFVRQMRFLGPKESFAWLEQYDPETFKLIRRALKYPDRLLYLKAAASRVFQVSLS